MKRNTDTDVLDSSTTVVRSLSIYIPFTVSLRVKSQLYGHRKVCV